MGSVLKLHQVQKKFGKKEVLKEVSFTLAQGEIVSVFGRNGSGKSTLLKILFGTLKAAEIHLEIDGKHIHPKKVIPNQLIGYLPQDNFLPQTS